jgi:hypothetical protein
VVGEFRGAAVCVAGFLIILVITVFLVAPGLTPREEGTDRVTTGCYVTVLTGAL